jgi:hypothetical protein
MPTRPLKPTHPDYATLEPVVRTILAKAGGLLTFAADVPQLIRTAIDEVIDAPRTNRFTLDETEKTEKTYLGTKIEILLRSHLRLPKGSVLDLNVGGTEVDIKNTMGGNWSIPVENVGYPAILIRSKESTAQCDVGLVVVKDEYLNPGQNRDSKRGISAVGATNIWWILSRHPYPPNFWEVLPKPERDKIMAAGGGTQRLAALFERIQKRPISRNQVQAVSQQHDYMKRIRRNGGARDFLAPKGIALLWGRGDRDLIAQLRLGPVGDEEFISYRPTDPAEIKLLRSKGHIP